MAEQVLENESVFLLHTEMTADGGVAGRIDRLSCGETVPFAGLDQALLMMNGWMDERGDSSDAASMRTFQTKHGNCPRMTVSDAPAPEPRAQWYAVRGRRGAARKKEAFLVRVICRQHTSWQGEIRWRNQRKYFRSCLEMIFLIQSVLSRGGAESRGRALPGTGAAGEEAAAAVN